MAKPKSFHQFVEDDTKKKKDSPTKLDKENESKRANDEGKDKNSPLAKQPRPDDKSDKTDEGKADQADVQSPRKAGDPANRSVPDSDRHPPAVEKGNEDENVKDEDQDVDEEDEGEIAEDGEEGEAEDGEEIDGSESDAEVDGSIIFNPTMEDLEDRLDENRRR